jgi:hypothetical protein
MIIAQEVSRGQVGSVEGSQRRREIGGEEDGASGPLQSKALMSSDYTRDISEWQHKKCHNCEHRMPCVLLEAITK